MLLLLLLKLVRSLVLLNNLFLASTGSAAALPVLFVLFFMYTSLIDVFSIGIGPSSSHTMGPMRAAARFIATLQAEDLLSQVGAVRVWLYGSLALTGEGHGTLGAIVYGLMGFDAETIDLSRDHIAHVAASEFLPLAGVQEISFDMASDIVLEKGITLPEHANGMRFHALTSTGELLKDEVYFSIGGVLFGDKMRLLSYRHILLKYPTNFLRVLS